MMRMGCSWRPVAFFADRRVGRDCVCPFWLDCFVQTSNGQEQAAGLTGGIEMEIEEEEEEEEE